MTRALFLFILFIPNFAFADAWQEYASETGLFTVLMPHEPDEELALLRLDNKRMVAGTHMSANIDQRPFRNAVKSYSVSMQQSFGPQIKDDAISKDLITAALNRVEREYAKYDAVVRDKISNHYGSDAAGEIFLSYRDEELGVQSVKKRFILTPDGLFEQTVKGPDNIMDSAKTRAFWGSIDIEEGVVNRAGSLEEEWLSKTSPLQIFTIRHPDIAYPYIQNEPKIRQEAQREVMSVEIYDPVLQQFVYYNVYGYHLDDTLTYAKASAVLAEQHIVRHRRDPNRIEMKRGGSGQYASLTASYDITGPQGYEYLERADLRAMFLGNYMVVQEFMGSEHLMRSQLVESLRPLISFTPERAFEAIKAQ
ncbi:MAG: hypothetical protein ACRBCT_04585 [Alphaproteobacteria bacterium]